MQNPHLLLHKLCSLCIDIPRILALKAPLTRPYISFVSVSPDLLHDKEVIW